VPVTVQVIGIDLNVPATGLQWRTSVVDEHQGLAVRAHLEAELSVNRLPVGI